MLLQIVFLVWCTAIIFKLMAMVNLSFPAITYSSLTKENRILIWPLKPPKKEKTPFGAEESDIAHQDEDTADTASEPP